MRRVEVEIRGDQEGCAIYPPDCLSVFGKLGFKYHWRTVDESEHGITTLLACGEFTDEQVRDKVLPTLRQLRNRHSPPYRITVRALQEVETYSLDEPVASQDVGKPPASREAKADLFVPFDCICGRDDGHD